MNPDLHQNDYYEQLIERLDKERPKDEIIVEIGTASGTTALRAISALGRNHSKRWLFTIDPYGDKPYRIGNSENLSSYDYNDDLHRSAMELIKTDALQKGANHTHWKMRSQDFLKTYEQIEFWSDGKILPVKFCLAFLDGEHSIHPVFEEFRWFYHHMDAGAVISIDDYNLIGTEEEIRSELAILPGEWFFNTTEAHHRAYFTKI